MISSYKEVHFVAIVGLLAIWLLLGGVALMEQLTPAIETSTQDEEALAGISNALKSDLATCGTVPAASSAHMLFDASPVFGLSTGPQTERNGLSRFDSSSLRLHQRLSTYRI